jgi:hypothetical protein
MAEEPMAAVRASFGPEHQALLFAWIAREVLTRPKGAGPSIDGEAVIRRGVWRYGVQRGARMAQRAQAAGHPLDYLHYLAYSEWRARPGAFDLAVLESAPDLHQQVYRCPWHEAWAANGLMAYGRLYCLDIDRAVVYGFNPQLILEVNGTHTNGSAHCDFIFRGAGLTPDRERELDELRAGLGTDATLPWDYHTGHLYRVVGEVVAEVYGAESEAMLAAAMAAFGAHFGAAAAQVVAGYADTDFDRPPERT